MGGAQYGQDHMYGQDFGVQGAAYYAQGVPAGQQMMMQQQSEQREGEQEKGKNGALPWQTEAERKAERAEMRTMMKAQKEKQDFVDRESTIKWLCSLGTVNAFLLIIPMFGNTWLDQPFIGLGVKILKIKISLFNIHVDVECGKNWLEDKFCKGIVTKMKGTHSLQDAKQLACSTTQYLPGNMACYIMSKCFFLNLALFGAFVLASVFSLCGVMFLSHYWYSKPLPNIRKWACFFYGASAFCAVGGLAGWGMARAPTENLPRAWTETAGAATFDLFAIKPVPGPPWGWCAYVSGIVAFSYALQFLLWPAWFQPHEKEEEAITNEVMAQEHIEQRILDMQNSMLPGGAIQQ
ncbi:unnamed protein product [Prorocentrum cordatum]|uniref:Uncharacterized protein n=1 Tax=Prorocentrum cordatum TaxID=2364126 RepID=A0ABN9PVT2_9DINO|nr:unnamed protein product [Polarella glacialis]